MKTLGLDLSLTATGICLLEDGNVVLLDTIKSKPSGKTPTEELTRLQKIVSDIEDVVVDHEDIDVVCIEGLAFMARNTTALVQLSGLNYLVRNMLHEYRKRFVIVQPTSLKKFATGSGASPKDVVILSTYKRFEQTILDNNQCDSFVLAKIGEGIAGKGDWLKHELEVLTLLGSQ